MPDTAVCAAQKLKNAAFMRYPNYLLFLTIIASLSTFLYAIIYMSSASGVKEVSSSHFLEDTKAFTPFPTSLDYWQLLSHTTEHHRRVQRSGEKREGGGCKQALNSL